MGTGPTKYQQQLIDDYASGMSYAKVAEINNSSINFIRNAIRKFAPHICRTKTLNSKYSQEFRNKIKDAYLSGLSLKKVGYRYGVAMQTAHKIIQRDWPEIMRPPHITYGL